MTSASVMRCWKSALRWVQREMLMNIPARDNFPSVVASRACLRLSAGGFRSLKELQTCLYVWASNHHQQVVRDE